MENDFNILLKNPIKNINEEMEIFKLNTESNYVSEYFSSLWDEKITDEQIQKAIKKFNGEYIRHAQLQEDKILETRLNFIFKKYISREINKYDLFLEVYNFIIMVKKMYNKYFPRLKFWFTITTNNKSNLLLHMEYDSTYLKYDFDKILDKFNYLFDVYQKINIFISHEKLSRLKNKHEVMQHTELYINIINTDIMEPVFKTGDKSVIFNNMRGDINGQTGRVMTIYKVSTDKNI